MHINLDTYWSTNTMYARRTLCTAGEPCAYLRSGTSRSLGNGCSCREGQQGEQVDVTILLLCMSCPCPANPFLVYGCCCSLTETVLGLEMHATHLLLPLELGLTLLKVVLPVLLPTRTHPGQCHLRRLCLRLWWWWTLSRLRAQ